MDFLIYSRGDPTAAHSDDPVLEDQHWTYMDGFADRITARGPTLGPDRQTWTGSMHVVDLSDPDAARQFVDREPLNLAGMYERHFIWRFTNLLGTTMWDFTGAANEPPFLVLVPASNRPIAAPQPSAALRRRLVVYGELRDDDASGEVAGLAMAVQAPSRDALDVMLVASRLQRSSPHDVEVHDWEFGGRR